jgi:hypothetical protein
MLPTLLLFLLVFHSTSARDAGSVSRRHALHGCTLALPAGVDVAAVVSLTPWCPARCVVAQAKKNCLSARFVSKLSIWAAMRQVSGRLEAT